MVAKRHNLSIVINGKEVEVENQDKINLRINNEVYNPEKLTINQTEYSFSFNLPKTPVNNEIFGFSNVPSVTNKFNKNYDTYVYADGVEIFHGVVRVSSIGEDSYKCNLVSIKNSSIDDIFLDKKMKNLLWEVPYNGSATQNMKNSEDDPDYFFPYVAYGVPQKKPYFSIKDDTTDITYYTSPNLLDKWVKWYPETFVPSPKLIEVVKRMIEQSGYKWSGDVFDDPLITKLYLSSSISNEQDPEYNWGDESRGKISIDFSHTQEPQHSYAVFTAADRITLNHPTDLHMWDEYGMKKDGLGEEEAYVNRIWLNSGNRTMYEFPYISIPSTGFYKIKIDIKNFTLSNTYSVIEDSYPEKVATTLKHIKFERPLSIDNLQYEIQLVKNADADKAFEFSSTNKTNYIANPMGGNRYSMYYTDYPHEGLGGAYLNNGNFREDNVTYYYQPMGRTRGYDPSVNDKVIMGVNTVNQGWSIAKRGRSHDKTYSDFGYNNYKGDGYSRFVKEGSQQWMEHNTEYQSYDDANIPSCTYNRRSNLQFDGTGYAVVWLEKGDLLELNLMSKCYQTYQDESDDSIPMKTIPGHTLNGTITVEAFSPRKKDLRKDWYSESAFTKNLNLGNFLSEEEEQKDFFNNFLTTFNLNCNVSDGVITINKSGNTEHSRESVNIDNRVNISELTTEPIKLPTSIECKFTIDEEESGFYHSVPDEHIDDEDWKDYADIGSERITLISNEYNKNDLSKTSKFSRNWMMDFFLTDYWSSDGKTNYDNVNIKLSVPIIAKDEHFLDGANYEEMEKVDGRSLKQRLWFKSPATDYYVPNRKALIDYFSPPTALETIRLCLPTNLYNGEDVLKYTRDKNSLLMRYFNVTEKVDSNYATVEVYLTPQEYIRLKNGATVRYDDEHYQICSITGYDPTGGNAAKIKMMKQ